MNLLNAWYSLLQIITTLAVLHDMQITTTHFESSQSVVSLCTLCLLAASDNGDSLYNFCAAQFLSLLVGDWPWSWVESRAIIWCWLSPAQSFFVSVPFVWFEMGLLFEEVRIVTTIVDCLRLCPPAVLLVSRVNYFWSLPAQSWFRIPWDSWPYFSVSQLWESWNYSQNCPLSRSVG
jgi:hypothetical protein